MKLTFIKPGVTMTWQIQDIIRNLKIAGGNSGVKQILTDCTSVSEVADLFIGNYFYELHEETTLCYYQKLLEDFLETCANVCLRKLLVVAKQSENIYKGVKHSTCANSMLCL